MSSRNPWQPELVLLFCGAQLLCLGAGILAAALLHRAGIHGFKNENDFGNILIATLCFQGVTWVLIPIFLRQHQVHWRDTFGLRRVDFFRALVWAMAALIVVLLVVLPLNYCSEAALQKIGWQPKSQEAVELLLGAPLWPTGIYLGIFAVVLAPVAEEFIFRGVLFPFVKQLGWPKLAWFGVSLLFALIHGSVAIIIPLFVLALALTWLYEKTGNLLAPIVVHGLFNAANLALLILAREFSLQLPAQP
jgi:membrane protease YdiL (CAAX protease family)